MKNTLKTLYVSGLTLAAVSSVLLRTGSLSYQVSPVYARETVTICHRSASHSNPYITQEPAADGDVSGHDSHDGPVWFSGITVEWGDIIPSFTFTGGSYAGQNWTVQGQAFYNNGCNIPSVDPTPTPTVTPTPTSTPTPTPTGEQVTPTPTPTGEQEVTPTPTPTVVASETPHPQPQNGVPGTPVFFQDQGSTQGQVLGASTMAETGVATQTLFNLFGLLGSSLIGLSFKKRK